MVEDATFAKSAQKIMSSVVLGSCASINTKKEISLIGANV
jgi:hypothetical protein